MNFEKEVKKIHVNIKSNQLNDAMRNCNKLIKLFPKNSYLFNLGGLILQNGLKIKSSIEYFKKSLEFDPKNSAAKNNIANSYKAIGKFDLAENIFKDLLREDPNNLKCLYNYGNLKQQIGDNKSAINFYEKALKIEPKNIRVLFTIAHCYQSLGNFDKAKQQLSKVLEIDDQNTTAHRGISSMTVYVPDHKHLKEMIDVSRNEILKDTQKIDLFFALGKAYEDIGDYEKAFNNISKANKIKRDSLIFNIKKEEENFDRIIHHFDKFDFSKNLQSKNSKKIIFICGMPRSGTTLIEQIIAAHKDVAGAGELEYLRRVVHNNLFENGKLSKQKIQEEIHMDSIKLSEDYHEYLKFHNYKEEVITDKAPMNFMWLGAIKLFFPNSKIIHCTRNPKDICLSVYKNIFSSSIMDWSYSQEDIAKYYNLYKKLMKFWLSKFAESIYEINYEKLIKDKDNNIKEILKFCELELDDNCFDHHQHSNTPIKTVSITQARSPIYSTSINKNQFYEKNLNKMFSLLE